MTTPASRREFMRPGTLASAVAVSSGRVGGTASPGREVQEAVERAMSAPLLRKALWKEPVLITSVDVLKASEQFLIRVRSQDGAVGTAVGHPDVLETTWPIKRKRVAPFFVGKDARDLEALIDGYTWRTPITSGRACRSGYPAASLELAVLDLLGKIVRSRSARSSADDQRDPRLSREWQPRQHAGGGDRLSKEEARRRNRRAGHQVPARRANA